MVITEGMPVILVFYKNTMFYFILYFFRTAGAIFAKKVTGGFFPTGCFGAQK